MVPLELVLVQTEELAIGVSRLAAYPTGFSFDLLVLAAPRPELSDVLDPLMFGPGHPPWRSDPEMLKFGVQFADGTKATSLSPFPGTKEQPETPTLHSHGSSGGGGRWQMGAWVWPLPPPGRLAFVCEWAAMRIPLTRREIDAQPILDAARRAQVMFSDQDLPEPPG